VRRFLRSRTVQADRSVPPINDEQAITDDPERQLQRRAARIALASVVAVASAVAGAALVIDFLSTEPQAANVEIADVVEPPGVATPSPPRVEPPAVATPSPPRVGPSAVAIPSPPRVERSAAVEKPIQAPPPQQTKPAVPVGEVHTNQADTALRPLGADDPRWGKQVEASPSAAEALSAKSEHLAERAPIGVEATAAEAGVAGSGDDERAPQSGASNVTALAPDQESTAAVPEPRPETDVVQEPPKPTRSARVSTAVNMRAGPRDEARVLGVVPANAVVQIVDCDGWCEVIYNGKSGFIYQSFFGGSKKRKAAPPKPEKVEEPVQAAVEPPKPKPAPPSSQPSRQYR
jgi:hypothetical protein